MLNEDLRPQIPPTRRDVLVTVLNTLDPESPLKEGVRIKRLMTGLAEAGQAGAKTFTAGGSHRAILETYANLQANGLMDGQSLTDDGIEYAELVDPETKTFIAGFVAGAEHMEERHRNC